MEGLNKSQYKNWINKLKHSITVFFILLLITVSCKQKDEKKEHHHGNKFHNKEIECLIIDYEIARQSGIHDSVMNVWNLLNDKGTDIFDYFIYQYLSDNLRFQHYELIPRPLGHVQVLLPSDMRSEVVILYLLTAIYYNDFDFALRILLYSKKDCNFNEEENKNGLRNFKLDSSFLDIKRAWEYLIAWRLKYKDDSLEELRLRERPIPKDLFWLGDTIGPLDRECYLAPGITSDNYLISKNLTICPCSQ